MNIILAYFGISRQEGSHRRTDNPLQGLSLDHSLAPALATASFERHSG